MEKERIYFILLIQQKIEKNIHINKRNLAKRVPKIPSPNNPFKRDQDFNSHVKKEPVFKAPNFYFWKNNNKSVTKTLIV